MPDSDLVPGADQPGLDGGLTTPALKSLAVDGLRLVPQFSATVSSYAATVETDVERLTLVATTADSRSSMSISHADADPDTDGHQVDFAVGVNVITFSIVAEDGVNAKTYKLVVTRARPDPDDASLSQLRISDVGLNPDFVAERINYETSLVAEVTRLTDERSSARRDQARSGRERSDCSGSWRPPCGCLRGDLQFTTARLAPEALAVGPDEAGHFGSRGSSSRAEQTGAAFSISLARRSLRCSRSSLP